MAACYAEDARLLAENAPLISGRATIEQFWRTAIERARAASCCYLGHALTYPEEFFELGRLFTV
jgi:hypothetical protein